MANPIRHIGEGDSGNYVGLDNSLAQVVFTRSSGQLCHLKNLETGTEFITRPDSRGNLFRLYIDSGSDPQLRAGAHDSGVPGEVAEAAQCNLQDVSWDGSEGVSNLILKLFHPDTSLTIVLTVVLKSGSSVIDVSMNVANSGTTAQSVRAAMPYLSGLGVGTKPEEDLALVMFDRGFPDDAAWHDTGGVYGKQVSMQWQCAYNREDSEGIAFITMDTHFLPKVLSRFSRGMQAYYANEIEIAPGDNYSWPPARIIPYSGSWRIAARAYRRWFTCALAPRIMPLWYRNEITMRSSSWFPTTEQVALWQKGEQTSSRSVCSYRDLPRLYLDDTNDLKEHAMWNQDVVLWPEIYGPWMSAGFIGFREDLGGREAFIDGVKETHRIGRRVAMYVAGYGIRKNSPLFNGGFWKDFAIVDPWGNEVTGDYVEGTFCCHGYKPWQDNIVKVCSMLASTGIDEIRLDELGMPFKPCFNPIHNHENSYDAVSWSVELVRRVREAVDQINPDCVITTEFYCDAYHTYTNGALVMGYAGTGLDVMRVALPEYIGISYHAGCAEAAITGAVPARTESLRREWPWEHLPFAGKPEYHPSGIGASLRWPELLSSFSDAVLYGDVQDVDPYAPADPRWKGHVWAGEHYHLLVGGFDDGSLLDKSSIQIVLPHTIPQSGYAYEINAETLEMHECVIVLDGDVASVEIHHQLSAVFMPKPKCKAYVQCNIAPTNLAPGGTLELTVTTLQPWAGKGGMPSVSVDVSRCTDRPIQTTLPASITVDIPCNLERGWYPLRIDGDVLSYKRWVWVDSRVEG